MSIQLSLAILRRNTIQRIAHISPDILVPILIQRQRARRVLDKQVQQAHFVGPELRQLAHNVIGDEIAAPRSRGQGDGFLGPGHLAGGEGGRCWEEEVEG